MNFGTRYCLYTCLSGSLCTLRLGHPATIARAYYASYCNACAAQCILIAVSCQLSKDQWQSVSCTMIIMMKDEHGIQRTYPVDNLTYVYVRSLISGSAGFSRGQMSASSTAAVPQTVSGNPSMGSLPSATSVHSSQSSLASQVSQASSFFSTTPER